MIDSQYITGMRVDVLNYSSATEQIMHWADEGTSRRVCVANVHMAMEAHDDPEFEKIVNGADMVTSDGVPLVWALKLLGHATASRVYGPDLVLHVCEAAEKKRIPIALYGGTPRRIEEFRDVLESRYPDIEIVCTIAPPFRPLTPEEDSCFTEQIVASGTRIVFVGIGCPRQERWMADHDDRIKATMIGVGAAFDFHSGHVRQAPALLQRSGLEWAFRFAMEPGRLWKRYLKHNPRFLLLLIRQLIGVYLFRHRSRQHNLVTRS